MNKFPITDVDPLLKEAERLMDYTQLRINNIKTTLEMTKDTIKPF